MKPIPYTKMEGTGNDFLLIDNRRGLLDRVKIGDLVGKACNRRFGIGADGVLLLQKDKETDFFMRYFNRGGDEASMCGNGARCMVRFARRLGLINDTCRFRTASGTHRAEIIGDSVRLFIGRACITEAGKEVILAEQTLTGDLVDVGIPHFVIAGHEIDALDFKPLARRIRSAPAFGPDGTNVNFIEILKAQMKIRTYERGVESETLACGTGSIAAAISAASHDLISSPVQVVSKGGILKISFNRSTEPSTKLEYKDITLEGPARFIADGIYYYDQG